MSDRGRRLRAMLDELGPTFVKFGQLLSTRPDVVPPDIVAELRGLQDNASPVPFDAGAGGRRGGARPADGPSLPRVRLCAARVGLDRPGASRGASRWPRGGGQGAAPGRRAADRGGPRTALPGGATSEGARQGARVHGPAGARRRVRALDPARARLRARGAERGDVPPELCARREGRRPAGHQAVLDLAHPHARVPPRARRSRTWTSRRCNRSSAARSPTRSPTPG